MCCSVSLQDALFFLKDFFTSLAAEVELFSPPEQEGKPQQANEAQPAHIAFGDSSVSLTSQMYM